MNELQNKLVEEFEDGAYAHGYMEGHLHDKLIAQIYWTRKERGWTQAELAHKAGMAQERISKIESGEFDSLTMTTLRKLAHALDVNLRLEFEPFSHAVYDVCHQSAAALKIPARVASLQELKSCTTTLARVFGGAPIHIMAGKTTTTGAPFSPGSYVTTQAPAPALSLAGSS